MPVLAATTSTKRKYVPSDSSDGEGDLPDTIIPRPRLTAAVKGKGKAMETPARRARLIPHASVTDEPEEAEPTRGDGVRMPPVINRAPRPLKDGGQAKKQRVSCNRIPLYQLLTTYQTMTLQSEPKEADNEKTVAKREAVRHVLLFMLVQSHVCFSGQEEKVQAPGECYIFHACSCMSDVFCRMRCLRSVLGCIMQPLMQCMLLRLTCVTRMSETSCRLRTTVSPLVTWHLMLRR